MTAELKSRFVEALRSGRYTQIKGALRTNSGHCAVGVLCDLFNSAGWEQEVTARRFVLFGSPTEVTHSYMGRVMLPPVSEMGRMGLTPSEIQAIVKLNDSHDYTFAQIADWVERVILTDEDREAARKSQAPRELVAA